MNPLPNHRAASSSSPISLTSKLSRARRAIAKLETQQQKLDLARTKFAKELADAEHLESIQAGQTEFIKCIEELDFSTREMVVSAVLQSTENMDRRTKIQGWVVTIAEQKSFLDDIYDPEETGMSNGTDSVTGVDNQ